ncbi:MAG TPA: cysteine--tRNA ligase, partial [Bacteroidales bacterium]|nr:cysteine--tRNA ligase [Bacteroidales bacterium]
RLEPSTDSTVNVDEIKAKCYEALDDDLNSPVLLAQLFEAVKLINSAREGTEKMTASDIAKMKELFSVFVKDILGLIDESAGRGNEKIVSGLMKLILDIRHEARQKKDFATSDKIREELSRLGITVRDLKDGAEWEFE